MSHLFPTPAACTSALHPRRNVLSDIQQRLLTNLKYFSPRVPSCRALVCTFRMKTQCIPATTSVTACTSDRSSNKYSAAASNVPDQSLLLPIRVYRDVGPDQHPQHSTLSGPANMYTWYITVGPPIIVPCIMLYRCLDRYPTNTPPIPNNYVQLLQLSRVLRYSDSCYGVLR